jgi:hypothetical protein
MLALLGNHDGDLKDPQSHDSDQRIYADSALPARSAALFVTIGTCTHLGCLPKAHFRPVGIPRPDPVARRIPWSLSRFQSRPRRPGVQGLTRVSESGDPYLCNRVRAQARLRNRYRLEPRDLVRRCGADCNELQPSEIMTSASLLGGPSAVSVERIPRAR